MYTEKQMYSIKTTIPRGIDRISLQLNLKFKELNIEFPLSIQDWRRRNPQTAENFGDGDRDDIFRISIPLHQLDRIHVGHNNAETFAVNLSLDSPPRVFRKADVSNPSDPLENFWQAKSVWFRQTDVVYHRDSLRKFPTTLQKFDPVVDLGRWTTYRLILDTSAIDVQMFTQMKNALSDYNVRSESCEDLSILRGEIKSVWEYMDRPPHNKATVYVALQELLDTELTSLPFEVRYQLEVCLSQRNFNEFNIGPPFIKRLSGLGRRHAQDLLESVANEGKRVFDPMSIFGSQRIFGTTSAAKVPSYCALIRSAIVTPTTIYFQTPTVEPSNRVIRQFSEYSDRFLRVRFMDEKLMASLPNSKLASRLTSPRAESIKRRTGQ